MSLWFLYKKLWIFVYFDRRKYFEIINKVYILFKGYGYNIG